MKLLPEQRIIHLATHGFFEDIEISTGVPGAIVLAPSGLQLSKIREVFLSLMGYTESDWGYVTRSVYL